VIDGSKRTDGKARIITHNLRSENLEGYTQEFIQNEAMRKSVHPRQIYMYHTIIAFSDKENSDNLNDEILQEIVKEYFKLRGRQGLFAAGIHRDKKSLHLHVVESGVEFRTGKAFRLPKSRFLALKRDLQEFHLKKFPELVHSTVNHGSCKDYVTDKEWQLEHRDERKSVKAQIRQTVTDCFAKARTQKEFLESLMNNGLHFYERNGIPTGIIHEEMKIRFSRLDIAFDKLRRDRTEEEMALQAIAKLRERTIHSKGLRIETNKTHQNER
jgi:hypothetical protein